MTSGHETQRGKVRAHAWTATTAQPAVLDDIACEGFIAHVWTVGFRPNIDSTPLVHDSLPMEPVLRVRPAQGAPRMAKADKIISGLLLAHGVLGCVWTIRVAAGYDYPLIFLVPNMALALMGVIGGIGCLLGKRWAAYTGFAFWFIQLFHILTPSLHFSFTLGINLVVSAGWFGVGQVGLNLFALAMLLWLGSRMKAGNSSFGRVATFADS